MLLRIALEFAAAWMTMSAVHFMSNINSLSSTSPRFRYFSLNYIPLANLLRLFRRTTSTWTYRTKENNDLFSFLKWEPRVGIVKYTQLLFWNTTKSVWSSSFSSSVDCRFLYPTNWWKRTHLIKQNRKKITECIIWLISSHGLLEGPVNKLNALEE